MKRFRFPLRPVAILRAHQEMRAKEAFALSVQAFTRAEQELAGVREQVLRTADELVLGRQRSFSAAAEMRALAAYRVLCSAEADAGKARNEAQQVMDQRRVEYVDAHRRLEVVKRLEEKARTAHRQEIAREEQAEFDDYAGRRFGRRSLESA